MYLNEFSTQNYREYTESSELTNSEYIIIKFINMGIFEIRNVDL